MGLGVVMLRLYCVSGSHSSTRAPDSSPIVLSACMDRILGLNCESMLHEAQTQPNTYYCGRDGVSSAM